jgi:glyoxylase-like metal-dependent hydrolase (beta-lactamase superfamily II)
MEVAPGVIRVVLPMPFELKQVNVYLLRDGSGYTLIDTGLQTDESRLALKAGLLEANIPLERISRILITHIHPDHFGLAAELRERTRAELVIHRLEVALMEPRYARAEDLVEDVARWLHTHGVPPAEAEFLKSASLSARELVSVVEPDRLLEGAERLALDGTFVSAVWTPGHSPGHCCFYLPDRRLLFSGDHLLPRISPNIGLHPQSGANPLADYLASLERIDRLPIETVLPAHGDPFDDAKERIETIRSHHRERKNAILALAQQDSKTGWQLALDLFKGVMARNVFQQRLALQETLAHCQALAEDGVLEKLYEGIEVRWRSVASTSVTKSRIN